MSRRIGAALIDILNRFPGQDERPSPRLTMDNLGAELKYLGKIAAPLAALENDGGQNLLRADVENLTVEQFRRCIAAILSYIRLRAAQSGLISPDSKRLIFSIATTQNVVRLLTDREALARSARMDPVPAPKGLDDNYYAATDPLVRTGHPTASPHREIPISTDLYGSKLVSYFYISGKNFPQGQDVEIISSLVSHDSDEFVYFVGSARSSEPGMLPMYLEGELDPYKRVLEPIEVAKGQWFLYDAKAPHFWFAPPNTLAFYVAGSRGGLFRNPIAFSRQHHDHTPGGSFLLFEDEDEAIKNKTRDRLTAEEKERTRQLLGNRLRRRRDAYQLSAKDIQERSRGRGITANVIGKIENFALNPLHVRKVAEFAESMDLPLDELFVRDPPFQPWNTDTESAVANKELPKSDYYLPNSGYPLPSRKANSARATPLFDTNAPHGHFAITPYHIQLPTRAELSKKSTRLEFWRGEAEVAMLVLNGKVSVHVAPDPILLALQVADHQVAVDGVSNQNAPFSLDFNAIDDLERRHLLYCDTFEKHCAYHFNAALPHAIWADAENTEIIVVTTYHDRDLPAQWVLNRPPSEKRRTP